MEIQISKINNTKIAGTITVDNTSDNKAKYENIYSIIWPLDKLVLNRIIKVKGRISWEKISIKGKNNINPTGEPYGSMWAIKDLNCLIKTQTIIGTQNSKESVRVWE